MQNQLNRLGIYVEEKKNKIRCVKFYFFGLDKIKL